MTSEQSEVRSDAPDVLTAVNLLLSEAADLLDESNPLTEIEQGAEREISKHITKAGSALMREQGRRRNEASFCRGGSATDNPCRRPATEWHSPDDEKPTLCAPHAWLIRRSEEATAWRYALEVIEGWVEGPANDDPYGHLARVATNMRDQVRTEYASAAAKARAAEIAAGHEPPKEGEPALTLEQEEELARLIARADSFVNARTFMEDAPEEVMEHVDWWVMVDALETAALEAGEEFERYKEELGLK